MQVENARGWVRDLQCEPLIRASKVMSVINSPNSKKKCFLGILLSVAMTRGHRESAADSRWADLELENIRSRSNGEKISSDRLTASF